MNQRTKRTPPRWMQFFIGAGALIACGIYLGTGAAEGFTTGRIVRAVIFGISGLILVFQYGAGNGRRCPGDESSPETS